MRIGFPRALAGLVSRRLPLAACMAALLMAAAAAVAPAAAQPVAPSPSPGAAQRAPGQAQPVSAMDAQPQRPAYMPSTVFVQAGVAEEAEMAIIGATWEWDWHRDFSIGRLGGYWEASIGRWSSEVDHQGGNAWVTQVGVTPVLRLYPSSWGGRWFVEGGIGFNFLQPIYRSASKRFSTTFNFGDHLAVGRRFGRDARHEVALRFQHFSNAGIEEPNPGENFLQLRYSLYF